MLYFVTDTPTICRDTGVLLITVDRSEAVAKAAEFNSSGSELAFVINRNSIQTQKEAIKLAYECNLHHLSKHGEYDNKYLWVEKPNTLPRFDVIEAPKVGDEVSYGFNGDYYPCGKISKVSAFKADGISCRRVETDTGEVFWRQGNTGTWLKGKTWALVAGHRDERNPLF